MFFEDIDMGTEIPAMVKAVNTRQLVKWAGASKDFHPMHYDKDLALSIGLPGVIVQGRLKAAFMGQLMTGWLGSNGVLKKLSCDYRGMDFPGQNMIIKGKVIKKYVELGENYIECEVWIENPKGDRNTLGKSVAVIQSRT